VQDTLPKQQARQKHKNNHQQQDYHRHSKTYHFTQPCPLEEKKEKKKKKQNSPAPSRMQTHVTFNKKSTQTTEPTFPTKGKNQKEEGI